jgi:hypothetical protein
LSKTVDLLTRICSGKRKEVEKKEKTRQDGEKKTAKKDCWMTLQFYTARKEKV